VVDYIAAHYDDCLCLDCLQALQRAAESPGWSNRR